jgi:outer membrane protein OmpA-like peptidoglycan-associated protein
MEMRNWCAALAMSALMALPLCAQQKNTDNSGGNSGNTGTAAEKTAAAPSAAKIVVVKGDFAVPATPRATPFPGPQAAAKEMKDTREPGLLVPKYEIAGMYLFTNYSPGDPFAGFSGHGGSASFTYNASKYLGLTGEVGGYDFRRNLFPLTGSNNSVNGSMMSFLFGPRLNLRKFDRFVPFAEFLIGGTRSGIEMTGTSTQSAFALAAGGGVDMVLTKNLAWRVAQMDYFMTNFSGPGVGGNARQDNFRIGSGLVVRFGIPNPPPPPNHPPVAACSVNPTSIYAGSGDTVAVHVNASDPDNDPLTYSYTATGGQISGNGAQAQFDATGLQPGKYTVNCKVSDGRGGNAEASTTVEVKEPPQIKQLELKLALHSIYFPTAQPTVAKPNGGLLASQTVTLDTLASDFKEYLKYRPDAHLILEGHADVRGAKEYNIKLSERRVERTKSYLVEHGVPANHIETKAFGFGQNMTDAQVKSLIEQDDQLAPEEKQKILKNLLTVRLANNRRVDVTLSTTGEQSVRRFPFSAKDALTLLSRGGGAKATPKTAAPKKPAKP